MVSSQARAEIERMMASRQDPLAARLKTLAEERQEWEEASLAAPLPDGAWAEPVSAGDVPAEWMMTGGVRSDRAVLLVHGGGYSSGSARTHRKLAALLSAATSARVLTPNYRLAPEHPFPAGLEDAIAAYRWLVAQGARDVVVAGDSAGGGLALSVLLALRDAGEVLPRCAILMSAWTDLTASSPSLEAHKDVDVQVTREDLIGAGRLYMGGGDPADPRASTLFADPAGLPPLLMQVGGDEVLLDDTRIFAERARAADVDVMVRIFEGMWHVFQFHAPEIPEAKAAMDDISAFIRAQLGE